jgi:hypothetical protein
MMVQDFASARPHLALARNGDRSMAWTRRILSGLYEASAAMAIVLVIFFQSLDDPTRDHRFTIALLCVVTAAIWLARAIRFAPAAILFVTALLFWPSLIDAGYAFIWTDLSAVVASWGIGIVLMCWVSMVCWVVNSGERLLRRRH